MKIVGTILALLATPGMAYSGHGSCVHRAAYVQQFVAVPVYQVAYQVGAGLREEAIATRAADIAVARALAENDAKWEGKVNQLFGSLRASMLKGSGTFTFQAGDGNDPQPRPVDPVPTDPPVVNGDGPQFTADFAAIVQSKCAKCHNANGPQQPIVPENTDANRASKIFLKTFSGDPAIRMPPSGELTDAQRESVFLWASEANKQSKGR